MNLATIRVLFTYNDWARDQLMPLLAPLDAGRLDREFDIGLGSLRRTMGHLYGAEWIWLARWKGRSPAKQEIPSDSQEMGDLWQSWRETADERDLFLDSLSDADLERNVTYTNLKGIEWTFKLGHMLLHVCNHGTHHRAQALNMLRRVGVPPPEMDFLRVFEA